MQIQYVEDLRNEEGVPVQGMLYAQDAFIRICYQKHGWVEMLVLFHEFLHYFMWLFTNNYFVHYKYDLVWSRKVEIIYCKYL